MRCFLVLCLVFAAAFAIPRPDNDDIDGRRRFKSISLQILDDPDDDRNNQVQQNSNDGYRKQKKRFERERDKTINDDRRDSDKRDDDSTDDDKKDDDRKDDDRRDDDRKDDDRKNDDRNNDRREENKKEQEKRNLNDQAKEDIDGDLDRKDSKVQSQAALRQSSHGYSGIDYSGYDNRRNYLYNYVTISEDGTPHIDVPPYIAYYGRYNERYPTPYYYNGQKRHYLRDSDQPNNEEREDNQDNDRQDDDRQDDEDRQDAQDRYNYDDNKDDDDQRKRR